MMREGFGHNRWHFRDGKGYRKIGYYTKERHALGIQYIMSRRDSSITGSHQRVGAWSLAYNFVGDSRFGAVEWRPAEIEGR